MRIFLCGGGDGSQTTRAYNKLNEIIDHTIPLLKTQNKICRRK